MYVCLCFTPKNFHVCMCVYTHHTQHTHTHTHTHAQTHTWHPKTSTMALASLLFARQANSCPSPCCRPHCRRRARQLPPHMQSVWRCRAAREACSRSLPRGASEAYLQACGGCGCASWQGYCVHRTRMLSATCPRRSFLSRCLRPAAARASRRPASHTPPPQRCCCCGTGGGQTHVSRRTPRARAPPPPRPRPCPRPCSRPRSGPPRPRSSARPPRRRTTQQAVCGEGGAVRRSHSSPDARKAARADPAACASRAQRRFEKEGGIERAAARTCQAQGTRALG